jgi:hypothetical protein
MEGTIIVSWIMAGSAVGGTIYAIIRNGSRRKEQDIELKAQLKKDMKGIKDQLEDPDTGLEAIKKATDDHKLVCKEISTKLSTEVERNKKEIDRLRDGK